MSGPTRNGNWSQCPNKIPFNNRYAEVGNGQRPVSAPVVSPTNGNGQRPVSAPVVSPTNGNGQRPMNGNGQRPVSAPVVSPTNGNGQRPMNGNGQRPVSAPVVSPTNGNGQRPMNGNGQRPVSAPVVSPTNGNGQRPMNGNGGSWMQPGKTQVASSRPQNGQTQAGGIWNQSGQTQAGGIWNQSGQTQSGQTQAGGYWNPPGQTQAIPNVYRAGTAGNGRLNLGESAQTYLHADSDGHIFAVRGDTHYLLKADEQGRVGVQADGQCNVWTPLDETESEQIHFFGGRGGEDDAIVVNNRRICGPVIAQMIRGENATDLINGMTPNGPVAPTTAAEDWYAQQW